MAIDTAAKRLSAMNTMCPWRGCAVVPSGTVNDSERATVLLLYSGFDYAGDDGGAPVMKQWRDLSISIRM
jgi:hypothetical protein